MPFYSIAKWTTWRKKVCAIISRIFFLKLNVQAFWNLENQFLWHTYARCAVYSFSDHCAPGSPQPPPKKKLYNKIAARSNPNFLKIMFSTCCQRYSLVIKSKVEILLLSLQLAQFQLKTCELGESQPCWKPCFRCHLCRRKDVGTPWGFSPAFGGHGPVRKPQREHCPCSHWQVTNF